ncbi:MAG: TraY domain-containing protein [Gammaproteobacteria bacterium]|nr:TraY domain-containing protein [Gammaproteobacteria bacterium]
MATIIVRGLPDALHERLKAQAKRNRRSLTKEAVTLIERHLDQSPPPPKLPPPLRLKAGPVTIKQIEAAIAKGRD